MLPIWRQSWRGACGVNCQAIITNAAPTGIALVPQCATAARVFAGDDSEFNQQKACNRRTLAPGSALKKNHAIEHNPNPRRRSQCGIHCVFGRSRASEKRRFSSSSSIPLPVTCSRNGARISSMVGSPTHLDNRARIYESRPIPALCALSSRRFRRSSDNGISIV